MLLEPNAKFISATADTLTMTGLTSGFTGAGFEALVTSGDGVGEHVHITGYNAATGVMTISGPWPVTPDSTSVVEIGEVFDGIVVYENSLSGKGVTNTASAGVELWGGGLNVIVDSNTMSNMRYGIFDEPFDNGGMLQPSYLNLLENNKITNVQIGIIIANDGLDGQTGNVGSIARDNQITSASEEAFFLRDEVDSGSQHFYVILEDNTTTDEPVGVWISNVGTNTTNLTLNSNSFSLGSGDASGAAAIIVDEGLVLTQEGNTYTGFPETVGGTVTPMIEAAVATAGNLLSLAVTNVPSVVIAPTDGSSSSNSSTSSSSGSSSTSSKTASKTTSKTTSTTTTVKSIVKKSPPTFSVFVPAKWQSLFTNAPPAEIQAQSLPTKLKSGASRILNGSDAAA
jgi:hypothetical protein